MGVSEPTRTKLEPTLTSLRKLAENHISFGQYKAAQMLLEAIDAIEQLEAENAKLRELCETFGMIANDAICGYDELAQANADAYELGVEL